MVKRALIGTPPAAFRLTASEGGRAWRGGQRASLGLDVATAPALGLSLCQVSEPRAAWAREIMSALARRQLGEQVRQGNVRPEPFDQNVATIATGLAARAIDAHPIVRELIERH
jgi:hypothetical protein